MTMGGGEHTSHIGDSVKTTSGTKGIITSLPFEASGSGICVKLKRSDGFDTMIVLSSNAFSKHRRGEQIEARRLARVEGASPASSRDCTR